MTKEELKSLEIGDLIIYKENAFGTEILGTVFKVYGRGGVKVREHCIIRYDDEGLQLYTDETGISVGLSDELIERFDYDFKQWGELNPEYLI